MSSEIKEQLTTVQLEENSSSKIMKNTKKSYSRDFLLSLSELEVCKKLPNEVDQSLLSELHETPYYGPQDRSRVSGSSSFQGFRRTVYGSSPPARGDSGSYSRGLQRWDSRSSAKTEGDSDSESGRRFGSQAKKTWQNPEHDGLLGSGSFPRPPGPPGHAAGSAVPRFHPNENLQLNKSNEPYQPPRPYKAAPHSRRETKDSFNDETFGSPDSTSEDRAEEEKIRRAQFELMRKEQHKAFQESKKLNSGKPKDSFSEMVGLLENSNDSKTSSGLDKALKDAPLDDASKLSVSSQAHPIRPLVPPGFVGGAVEKSSALKSHMHSDALQVKNLEMAQGHEDVKSLTRESGSSDWFGDISNSSNLKPQKNISSVLHGADLGSGSTLPSVTEDIPDPSFDSVISGHEVLGAPVRSTSILDKLFGNGLTTANESNSDMLEGDVLKADDIWSPDKLQSKFARWFSEDDKKTLGNSSVEKPSSLLSLIIGGEKGGNNGLNVEPAAPNISADIIPELNTSKSLSFTDMMPGRFSCNIGPIPKPSVLTCEDLEQSMLSEIGGDISSSRYPEKEQDTFEVKKDGLPGTVIDNSASQRLLSLLQGGMSSNNAAPTLFPDQDHKNGKSSLPESSTETSGVRELNQSDRSLTLEALFGTAFMKELQTVASGKTDVSDSGSVPPKMGENEDGLGSLEGNVLATNDVPTKSDKVNDWLDSQDTGMNREFPEEDSFFNLVDPINGEKSVWLPNSSSRSADYNSFSSNPSVNIMEKLAGGFGGDINNERSMIDCPDPRLLHNPHMGKPEIPYQNLHPQTSSPQFHRPPMNQNRPFFHPLDLNSAHIDPHMKFTPPETIIRRNAPMSHHFPANMGHPLFPHSGADLPAFDGPIPSPVFQQMLMSGNHPPSHLARGPPPPGAAPMPPHPGHNPVGFIQEHNPMQGGFPFIQRQPSFGGPAMPIPGAELGAGNHPPEAFQRFLEMEMQANPKQMHPFASTGGPSRGKFGHEFDMGYRYR